MATTTSKLGLPRPTPTDNVSLANHQALIDAIDNNAAKVAHTHDGTAGNGAKITAAGLTDGAATDTVIGNRTADPTLAPSGVTGTITQLFSWITNRIKAITGATNWYDAPPTTLTAANTHMNATTGVHGATSAATANALITRDASGRAQVAAPVAAADIARKDTVDAVATVANAALPASSYTAVDVLAKVKTVDGAGSGLDADLFDGSDSNAYWKTSQLRTTNGYLEWLDGGTWVSVGNITVGKPRTATLLNSGANGAFITVLDISGAPGRIERIVANNTTNGVPSLRVTIDGVVETITGASLTALSYLDESSIIVRDAIYFNNSLKVEASASNTSTFPTTVDYRLKVGTP